MRDADGLELPEPEKAAPADLWPVLRMLSGIADDMSQEPHSFAVAGPLLVSQFERVAELGEWVTECARALSDELADDLRNGRSWLAEG
ncbi:hypothetical protein [Streptomyces sp. LS1784]|uniref:hypothetical protein n=1 Tax=Streptomyces sp. LS1784 TaxID=2851533 RepID=UPI001CCB4B23|nr:hypothetical protein [Streptomyces sp. LS1784]